VVQGHDDLEQARCTRRCFGVSDLRLHRAERAPRLAGLRAFEHLSEPFDFGQIACPRAGPVRLDELDVLRTVAAARVSARDGLRLTLGARRVDAQGAPVGRRANPADDGVHMVAIALGVSEALQREETDTLTDQRAICVSREGPAGARSGQGADQAEALEHQDIAQGIGAARDDEIGAPQVQLVHRRLKGGERAPAGGIDDVIAPAEVETVRNAAGDHVAQQSRKRVLLPGNVAIHR
jgi:hypothetical protein